MAERSRFQKDLDDCYEREDEECDEDFEQDDSVWDAIERMNNESITDEDLENAIGKTLQFEYKSQTDGWTYDEDIITHELIAASTNFRNMKII